MGRGSGAVDNIALKPPPPFFFFRFVLLWCTVTMTAAKQTLQFHMPAHMHLHTGLRNVGLLTSLSLAMLAAHHAQQAQTLNETDRSPWIQVLGAGATLFASFAMILVALFAAVGVLLDTQQSAGLVKWRIGLVMIMLTVIGPMLVYIGAQVLAFVGGSTLTT